MTYDIKKYPGYTEMIFKNRKSTLTRKKSLASISTKDDLAVNLYDFYNKFYFFMKFDGFEPMINVYDDQQFRTNDVDGAVAHYTEKFANITINDVERIIIDTAVKPQNETVNPEFIEFCQEYMKRKGLDAPEATEEPKVKMECHLLGYDENGNMTYQSQPMEDEDLEKTQEEQNEIAPLSFSETETTVEDDEWAGFPPETNLEELKPQDITPEDEAVFEQVSESKEVTPNFKTNKKSKKKSSKKNRK